MQMSPDGPTIPIPTASEVELKTLAESVRANAARWRAVVSENDTKLCEYRRLSRTWDIAEEFLSLYECEKEKNKEAPGAG